MSHNLSNRWAKVCAVLLLAAAPLSLNACGKADAGKGKGKPNAAAPRAVRAARVQLHDMSGGLTSNGVLAAREEAVVSSELQGYRVNRVFVDVDQWVRAGQPLVQLDDTLIRSQITQQRATLAQTQVAAAQAADQAARVKGLDDEGVLAQEQVESRRFAARSANAAVSAQRAVLQDLLTRQQRLTLRSPVSGRVMERNVRPGDISGGGTTPMFRIIRDGLVELEAQVPEGQLGRVTIGSPAQVILPNSGSVYGRVRYISPAVDPQNKLGKVRISLPPRPDLRPGGFARAVFTGAARPAVAVPEAAVRYSAEGPSVMTLDAQGRAREISVRTGQRGGGWVELASGPRPGALVLMGGAAFVLEGDKVKPVMTQEAAAAAPAPATKG